MKLPTLPLALLTAMHLGSAAAGNMWIYQSMDVVSGTGASMYYFFHGYPSCNDVRNAPHLMERGDVSGTKTGFLCQGSGCYNGNPNDIIRVEMNAPWGHYTIYRDRSWNMVDLKNRVVGYCRPTREDDFFCASPMGQSGYSIIHCTTDIQF